MLDLASKNWVKRTQLITWILVVTIIVTTPFIVGLIFNLTDYVRLIDRMHEINVTGFWILMCVSRIGLSLISWVASGCFIGWLEKRGCLWFDPANELEEPERMTFNQVIAANFFFALLLLFSSVVMEVAIRTAQWLLSGSVPNLVYLPLF